MQEFLVENLGYIAGFFTTIAFLPQVIKVWRTKSTKDISIWMFLIFTTGVLLWLIYGLLIINYSLIIANTITLILSISILIAKIFKFKIVIKNATPMKALLYLNNILLEQQIVAVAILLKPVGTSALYGYGFGDNLK